MSHVQLQSAPVERDTYTNTAYSIPNILLSKRKRHPAHNTPMTTNEQPSSGVSRPLKYNTLEPSINLNEAFEVRLMDFGRTDFFDDGI